MFEPLKKLFRSRPSPAPASPAKHQDGGPAASPVTPGETVDPTFLRREPVFDRQGHLVGHLFTTPGETPDGAALLAMLHRHRPASTGTLTFVVLPSHLLGTPALDRLEGAGWVLLFDLQAGTDPAAVERGFAALRERGICPGVVRQPEHPAFAIAVRLADYAAVRVADVEPDAVRNFSAALRASAPAAPLRLLALAVDTQDEHRFCHQWHYELFQGDFTASAPRTPVEKPGADPQKFSLLNLLRLLQSDAETSAIAEAMKADPMLAFRILRYLNSPLIGLDQPVSSMQHALTLMGRQRLVRWLAVLLFSVRTTDIGDWILVESALTRGRMMEQLGRHDGASSRHDELFLTGIFSCLERLLHRPIADILDDVPVSPAVRQALTMRSGPHAPLLAVAEAGERFDLEEMTRAAEAAGLSPADVNRALLEATAWASEVTAHWE